MGQEGAAGATLRREGRIVVELRIIMGIGRSRDYDCSIMQSYDYQPVCRIYRSHDLDYTGTRYRCPDTRIRGAWSQTERTAGRYAR